MSKIIAYCGLVCSDCEAFTVTQQNDNAKRKELAATWSKRYGHEFKPEDINCVGCLSLDGPHIGYCSVCEIRKCGIEKGVENCAYCVEYKCEKLGKMLEQAPKAKAMLAEMRKNQPKKSIKKKPRHSK
jgi:hypothetical protein